MDLDAECLGPGWVWRPAFFGRGRERGRDGNVPEQTAYSSFSTASSYNDRSTDSTSTRVSFHRRPRRSCRKLDSLCCASFRVSFVGTLEASTTVIAVQVNGTSDAAPIISDADCSEPQV